MKTHALVIALALSSRFTGLAAVTDGLVHHWSFDEGPDWHDSPLGSVASITHALDLAGGWHATLVNLAGSNWVSGHEFTCIQFPGTSAWLNVGQNLAPELGSTASLSFWIRTTQAGGSNEWSAPGIAGAADGSHANGIQWGWLDTGGCLNLSADGVLLARTAQPVNDGTWHVVVLTRDAASGTGQVFLDGALSDSRPGPAGNRALAFQSLGRIENPAGSAGVFAGRLDQVTVFNRVITDAEVATLKANHAPKVWDAATEGVNSRPFVTESIFAKAYDVENDALTVRSWASPAHGSVSDNGDGSFTYTATPAYVGADSFAVVVEDGQGGFHRAMMNVTVMSEPPGGGGVPVTQFVNCAPLQANGTNMSHSGWRVPRVIEWNGDGRPDLLVGAGGYVWLYTNNGTAQSPSFAVGVRVKGGGADIYAGNSSSPIALADLSGDGVADLVLADSASKLRIYRNAAAAGQAPLYASPAFARQTNGADLILADRRFDLGDWNNDGLPDLVTGSFSGAMQLFLNTGTATAPRFGAGQTLVSDSYNIYPRIFDLNGNGLADFLRGINWGDIRYWRDAGSLGLANSTTLSITDTNGASPDLHALTDGAMVDFGDFNSDGKLDLVLGGHAGDKLYLAYGVRQTVAESLAEIEAIYDAHPTDLGPALSANTNALLNVVNNANRNVISHVQNGTLGTRETVYRALTNHLARYPFLKYQQLHTTNYHHVPGIVLQNWVMLEHALPDTPARRTEIADAMGLSGTPRTIFLESSLALGDNAKSIPAAYGTIRDFMRRHPRELFPDAVLTIDQLYGDGRGGFIWTPDSTKNTFGDWAVGLANEWAGDLTTAIERVYGAGAASGDYFTFVMGHEVTHSLDGYVNSRANQDLRRRWGLMLCLAAGPEVVPGANGWIDWTATQNKFQQDGLYNPARETWTVAWSNYWNVGYGATFKDLSFMRFDISWFLSNPQESLATQANHHWAHGPGRLVGAVDRFRRATTTGLLPMKANLNEVVTFIDYLSAGMNRVNLVETKTQSSPKQVNWFNHYADLERNDRGSITRIAVDGFGYDFTVDTNGVVTDVRASILTINPDHALALSGQPQPIPVGTNDTMLDGRPVAFDSFTQPAHGTVTNAGGGVLVYQSAPGYTGADSFTYRVSGTNLVVTVQVLASDAGIGVETWWNISGSTVRSLTTSARFPDSPDEVTNVTAFELPSNRASSYGSRARALLLPPQTGDYTFWIASDDNGELWLSTNALPSGKTLIARVPGTAAPRQWTKYPEQQSVSMRLEAGKAYYVEALFKESSGNDNLAVAWSGPGFDGTNVISGANLAIYGLPHPPPVAITSPRGARVTIPAGVGLVLEGSASSVWGQSRVTGWWSQASGPGLVVFESTNAPATGAVFPASGTYLLRWTATDGTLSSSADLTVNVGFVPDAWAGAGIGTTPAGVRYTQTSGVFNVTAGGLGVQSTGTDDDFYFVSQPARGDVQITARVVSVQNVTGSSSRAGVMLREELTRNAREAFMGVTSLSAGRFIWRATPGGTSGNTAMTTLGQPYWVRLVRAGNTFTAYTAPNVGNAPGAWTSQGSQTIAMNSAVFIGLAGASGSAAATGSVVADNVTLTPSQQNIGPLVNAGSDRTATNATFTLSGTASDDGLPNPPALLTTQWSQISGPGPVAFGDASATNTAVTFLLGGAYSLRLTADDGQVKTFDDALITANIAPSPPHISGFTQTGNGEFQFTLTDLAVTSYTLLVSTNLELWNVLAGAFQYSNGIFRITDPAATSHPARFYRLCWP